MVEAKQPGIWGGRPGLHFATLHPPRVSKQSPFIVCHLCRLIIIRVPPVLWKGNRQTRGLAARRGRCSVCTKGSPHHRTWWPSLRPTSREALAKARSTRIVSRRQQDVRGDDLPPAQEQTHPHTCTRALGVGCGREPVNEFLLHLPHQTCGVQGLIQTPRPWAAGFRELRWREETQTAGWARTLPPPVAPQSPTGSRLLP